MASISALPASPSAAPIRQHSHLTAETFLVHTGKWRFVFGANKDEGYLDVEPGDVATVPTHMFRGFEKRDEGTGFLAVVLGHDDPGKVVWAPSVFKMAEDFGLKLLKGGKLIDTTLGEKVPEGAELEQPPTAEKMQGTGDAADGRAGKICAQGRRHEGQSELAAGRRGCRGSAR